MRVRHAKGPVGLLAAWRRDGIKLSVRDVSDTIMRIMGEAEAWSAPVARYVERLGYARDGTDPEEGVRRRLRIADFIAGMTTVRVGRACGLFDRFPNCVRRATRRSHEDRNFAGSSTKFARQCRLVEDVRCRRIDRPHRGRAAPRVAMATCDESAWCWPRTPGRSPVLAEAMRQAARDDLVAKAEVRGRAYQSHVKTRGWIGALRSIWPQAKQWRSNVGGGSA